MIVSMTSAIQLAFPGLLGFGFPGGYEWIILLILGLLIFGRRLPEVGRSLGKGIVEFKRGIKGIEDEIHTESSRPQQISGAGASAAPGLEPPAEARVSREAVPAAVEPVRKAETAPVAEEPAAPDLPEPSGGEPDRAAG